MAVNVTIKDGRGPEADEQLHTVVIPMLKSLPGFVANYHMVTADGTKGLGVIIFDSEENAAAAAQGLAAMPRPEDNPVTIDRVDTYQVIAR